ncbi:sulfatase-like hydrolase/transferase [Sedimentibacter sp. zth1]|nr:sulfatase-like hydrolase/transferase [Sedimentibacter sp. zth1]
MEMVFFPLLFFYLESIYKIFALKNYFDFSLVYILISSIANGILLYFITSLFSKKSKKIVVSIFVSILCFVTVVQYVYYLMFYTPMVFYSIKGAGQVLEFVDMIFDVVITHIIVILALVTPIFLTIFVYFKKFDIVKVSLKRKVALLLGAICLNAIMFVVLLAGGTDYTSDFEIYYKTNIPNLIANRFGVFKTVEKDFTCFAFNQKVSLDALGDIDNHLIEDKNKDNSNEKDKNYEQDILDKERKNQSEHEVIIKIDTSPNVLDINFDELIENETDENIIKMHKYFATSNPTKKNEYTGIFKDYNLILITAESFSHLAIDKELTPTLYKMVNEGFVFNNFYNPVWGVSTSDGEYVACQSLIPKQGVWSFYESSKNYLPFTMGNQFKKIGYDTRAYHNHYFDFYRRDVSHPNMGYIYKGLGNGLDVKESWPESDLEMMELTIPEYINDKKFHTYYMTVSGHKNYTFYGNYIAGKNKELVESLEASEPVKAYLACNIELDKAMEYLISQLEEKGIADKTVIAMSADHYPYGLEKDEIDEIAGHEVENNFELYKSAFILWTENIETKIVDKACSSLDIIPTLSNLFGLEYDSRLYMGRDILSDSKPLIIFANRSFITDKIMYNALTKEITNLTNEEISDEYINAIKKTVSNKFLISQEILNRDYYSYIIEKEN